MNCPYCAEPVNEGAAVCKTCRRDIALVASLTAAKHALEEKVNVLEAELEILRERTSVEAAVPASPVEQTPPPRLHILELLAIYIALPTMLLISVHYLLIIKFDVRLEWLRAASILLPALFGWMLARKAHPRWFVALTLGFAVGFPAVFGMSTMVHFTDGDPILPHNARVWRETLEYIASIALSYLLGALIAGTLRRRTPKNVRADSKLAKLAAFAAKHATGGNKKLTLEEQVQRIIKLGNMGVSAATGLAAVYAGFKELL